MVENWKDAEERLLARSIFGTDDPEVAASMILEWMDREGLSRGRVAAIELSVGAAVRIDRSDHSTIFVKIWPAGTDTRALSAQMALQGKMAASGFPAPAVLTGLSALGPGWAAAMEHHRAGIPTDVRIPGVRRQMAAGLARFVSGAEAFRDLEELPRRSLPIAGAVWPKPHSALFDFAATARGAEWIDDLARAALASMRAARSRVVVSHDDWNAKNMRMGPDGIAVVYDWDAVFLNHETLALGSAAAHFPMTWELDVPETPGIDEVAAFVREYQQARGVTFTVSELAEVAASATYARAYKARCEHAIDPTAARWHGSSRESLEINGPFKFDRR
jgi:hypothetical protein